MLIVCTRCEKRHQLKVEKVGGGGGVGQKNQRKVKMGGGVPATTKEKLKSAYVYQIIVNITP